MLSTEDIPPSEASSSGNQRQQDGGIASTAAKIKNMPKEEILEERWKYTFDHGNNDEFKMTIDEPESCMNPLVNRYNRGVRRFWLEIFASPRLVLDWIIFFVIYLLRFIIRDIFAQFFFGILVVICDYLLKPCLAVSFSSFLQPILIFVTNLLTSCCNVFRPPLEALERLVHILAHLCQSIRLVEIHYHTPQAANHRTAGNLSS